MSNTMQRKTYLYARKEPSLNRERFEALTDVSDWLDTCLYRDLKCQDLAARFLHGQDITPKMGDKTARVNGDEFYLAWLPQRRTPRVAVFEDWADIAIYDYTQESDHFNGGEILVMLNKGEDGEQERRIGTMYGAWPFILIGESDAIDTLCGVEGVPAICDWLTRAGEAVDPLLRVLIMNPTANLDDLLRWAERVPTGPANHPRPPAL